MHYKDTEKHRLSPNIFKFSKLYKKNPGKNAGILYQIDNKSILSKESQ